MPRPIKTEIASLLQEVRAMELLADEIEVSPGDLQRYWDVSADLITLATDIEEYGAMNPGAGYEEPEMLDYRRRLRGIAARLGELALE